MRHYLRAALASFFGLLRVRTTGNEVEGAGELMQRALPANFAAIALNGLCFPTAGRILGAGLLLTWFVSDLTNSAFLVGLIVSIQYGLALVAQPLVAEWLSARPRRAVYYTAQSLLRAVSWCALGVAAWVIGRGHSALLLGIFFLVVGVDAAAAGLGNIAFSDTLARVIPQRLRGRARSWRGIFGGVAAGMAGILIRLYFPQQSGIAAFGLLFAVAGVLYAAGGLIFALIDEPEKTQSQNAKPGFSDLWQKMIDLWRNDAFRSFVYVESLLVPITQALPFFTLFARRGFDIEASSLGLLVVVDATAPVAGNFLWGRFADSRGNRWTIAGAALCGLLAPILGILLYVGGGRASWYSLGLLAVVVFAIGIASSGIDLATKNYVLDLSPGDAERPLYIGVNDTLVGLPTMLLAAVGLIVDLFGFLPVFIGLGALTTAGALLAAKLSPGGQSAGKAI